MPSIKSTPSPVTHAPARAPAPPPQPTVSPRARGTELPGASSSPPQKQVVSSPTWNKADWHPDQFGKTSSRSAQVAPRAPAASASPANPSVGRSASTEAVAPVKTRGAGAESTQSQCDKLGAAHGTSCSTKIYQSDRPQGTAGMEFPGTRNGVCVGMSSDWIRANILDDKHGGTDQAKVFKHFAENTNGNGAIHDHFSHMQQEYLTDNKQISALQQKASDAATVYRRANEAATTAGGRPQQGMSSIFSFKSAPPSPEEVAKKKLTAQDANQQYEAALSDSRSRLVGNVATGKNATFSTFDNLQNNFTLGFPNDGYHQVSIFKGDNTGGHDFAVKMGAQPSLLDPNSGEWKFQSKEQMNHFMGDYLKTVYPSYSGGRFESVRYTPNP